MLISLNTKQNEFEQKLVEKMKITKSFILLWIILQLAWCSTNESETNEDTENDDSDISHNDGLPPHEFKFKLRTTKKGKNAGEKREMVSLIIPPWVFGRKDDATDENDMAYFRCNTCRPQNTIAEAIR